MPAVRTSFYLAPDTQVRLRLAAQQLGRSQTALVNEALETFLRDRPSTALRSIGAGADGAMGAAEVKRWARERMARGAAPMRPKVRR
jgi:predicted DNA-binding protein